MMTEQPANTQTLVERDALYPSEPTTDEVIILGNNSYPTKTEALPVLIDSTAEYPERGSFFSAVQELDGWLLFKVKTELVSQIYTGITPEATAEGVEANSINISKVATILESELISEKAKHEFAAQELENDIIPVAQIRTLPDQNSGNPYKYWQKDIDNLYDRVEVHNRMSAYIDAFQNGGEDTLYEATEQYIERMYDMARNEVISILRQKKHELEAHHLEDERHIHELEGSLKQLTGERDKALEQVQERDMQMLDHELIDHLTQEAKDLAA